MKQENWARIQEIVSTAADLEGADQSEYLQEACGSDAELLAQAESFLRAHQAADGFLENASWAPFAKSDLQDEQSPPPDTTADLPVGSLTAASLSEEVLSGYRITRKLAQGGMGTVYLAERADGSFSRQVAIKVMRQLPGAATFRRRFQREGYILADLEHPNIARLLDAGTAPGGHPYFVMEYIDGEAIDHYCESRELPLSDRLELFRKVCAAVHTAHRNLVVHRDLKPSNILVDDQGEPKLLDFGIAKLLEPEALPFDIEETRTGTGPMTPLYASPEQVRGKAITTASDIYSLGVLLYKLLVGRLPYDLETDPTSSLTQAILQQTPSRPSTAVASEAGTGSLGEKALSRHLAGDLDTIVLKALRKEPDRRYASAEQFAEDLERFLKGQPVIARPDTFSYRTSRFVSRHRWAVSGAALVAAVLVGSTITVLLQARQLAHQRDQAQLERDKAKQVSAFMVDIFEQADPNVAPGQSLLVRDVLHQASARLQRELSGQDEIRAELKMSLGRIYSNLGDFETGAPLALEALETRRDLFGENHSATAEDLEDLGFMNYREGNYGEAERFLLEALQIRQSLQDPAESARCLSLLGTLYRTLKDFPKAEDHLRRALAVRQGNPEPDLRGLADSINELAITLGEQGKFKEAEPFFLEALELREKALPPDHPDLASSLEGLGIFYGFQGDLEICEAYVSRSLAIREATLPPDHPTLATSRHNMAVILSRLGKKNRSEELFLQALEIRKKIMAPESIRLFESYDALASLYLVEERPEDARDILNIAIDPTLALLSEDPENDELKERLVHYYQRLGNAHKYLGETALARDTWEKALELFPAPETPSSFRGRAALTRALLELGNIEAARPIYRELMISGFRNEDLQLAALSHGLESVEKILASQGGSEKTP